MDRNYQCYRNFDPWQEHGRHFVCRIKVGAFKTCLESFWQVLDVCQGRLRAARLLALDRHLKGL